MREATERRIPWGRAECVCERVCKNERKVDKHAFLDVHVGTELVARLLLGKVRNT